MTALKTILTATAIFIAATSGIAAIALLADQARADTSCGSTYCFDPCSSGYKLLSGNTCDTFFDFQQGCYTADAYCSSSGGGGGPISCGTISCFDQCSGSYVTVAGNSCTSEFDFANGCYAADGECN